MKKRLNLSVSSNDLVLFFSHSGKMYDYDIHEFHEEFQLAGQESILIQCIKNIGQLITSAADVITAISDMKIRPWDKKSRPD